MFLPTPHVLDVRHRLHRVLARQWVRARRVPLHREEVEPALGAEHVQLGREIGAVTPGARTLAFARGEVVPATRTLIKAFPPRHGTSPPGPGEHVAGGGTTAGGPAIRRPND